MSWSASPRKKNLPAEGLSRSSTVGFAEEGGIHRANPGSTRSADLRRRCRNLVALVSFVAALGMACGREDIELDGSWKPGVPPTCDVASSELRYEGTAHPAKPAVLIGKTDATGSIRLRPPEGWSLKPLSVNPGPSGEWAALVEPASVASKSGWIEAVQGQRCLQIETPALRNSPAKRPLSVLSLPLCQVGKESLLRFEIGIVLNEGDVIAFSSPPSIASVADIRLLKERATTEIHVRLSCKERGGFFLLLYGAKLQALGLELTVL